MTAATVKIWANSGDSHVMEPPDLWSQRMPADLAERMPRSEQIDDRTERLHVDGRSFDRKMQWNPEMSAEDLAQAGKVLSHGDTPGLRALDLFRPPGSWDVQTRLVDLDDEGIWAEIVYPSLGLWTGLIKDRVLYREGVTVFNDWLKETFVDVTPRCVPAAEISTLSPDDAIAEAHRVVDLGFKAINIPTMLDSASVENWNYPVWEPLWDTIEELGLVVASHIGSEAKEPEGGHLQAHHGPGGAILNYVETSFGGQRLATMFIASGILDRHPSMKLLISEGGASWMPFIADRMDESYRQHGVWVRPKLTRRPSEIMREQVYASFQHDKSAVEAHVAMGYPNVMWGADYPHLEGTFGHTQETLHKLFDHVDAPARDRMTRGAFLELFPHVGEPPADDRKDG
jgi:predicted TIM-barrel fold metal-dependent hydrolase